MLWLLLFEQAVQLVQYLLRECSPAVQRRGTGIALFFVRNFSNRENLFSPQFSECIRCSCHLRFDPFSTRSFHDIFGGRLQFFILTGVRNWTVSVGDAIFERNSESRLQTLSNAHLQQLTGAGAVEKSLAVKKTAAPAVVTESSCSLLLVFF
jgi:hypothetical protein